MSGHEERPWVRATRRLMRIHGAKRQRLAIKGKRLPCVGVLSLLTLPTGDAPMLINTEFTR